MAERRPTAADVVAACRLRWGKDSAVFEQVGNTTGFRCNRHADLVAMGLWASRGIWLEGVEIKVSRSDWLAELKKPDKADPIAKFCDFWWLAVGDASIVKDGELPERWGLLVLDDGKLKCKKQAPKLDAEPLDRGFVAALLRRAAEAQQSIAAAARADGLAKGRAEGPQHDPTTAEIELKRLKESVATFQQASGIEINSWDGGQIGEIVGKIRKLNDWRSRRVDPGQTIERAAAQLEAHAKEMRAEAKSVRREMRLAAGVSLEQLDSEEKAVG